MNIQDMTMDKILVYIKNNKISAQRQISKATGYSLGKVNNLIKECIKLGYLSESCEITAAGEQYLNQFKVDNAIILAAGFGSRFVPITYEKPKGLVEVNGEVMVERQIKHLMEKGITDITLVVGYMKESFDYLIDKYGVKLVYNKEYNIKNNLASLYCVRDKLKNTYILSSDNYITQNIYSQYEASAWYSCAYAEGNTKEYCLVLDKKDKIIGCNVGGRDSWFMYGSVYFDKRFSDTIIPLLEKYNNMPGWENKYWEDVFIKHIKQFEMYANKFCDGIIYEFENLEELREYDKSYLLDSRNKIISIIKQSLNVKDEEITNILPCKLGMTNNSFIFNVKGQKYICRIPGAGSEKFIDRGRERDVYAKIKDLNISEKVIYFDSEGIKISEFIENARLMDKNSPADVALWGQLMNKLHKSGIQFKEKFDCRSEINRYKNLAGSNIENYFKDINDVIEKGYKLCDRLQTLDIEFVPCHIDAHHENILIKDDDKIVLLDWEYAGMCDEIADVSMCAIYSYYSQQQAENLLKIMLGKQPNLQELFRLYSYMSLGGLIWTLWVLYKQESGADFGDYILKMYRYAKDYYKKAMEIYETIQKN